ncbi:MAG: VanZ family protein [Bacteroidales bacterium]|jgi:VanZ family protein
MIINKRHTITIILFIFYIIFVTILLTMPVDNLVKFSRKWPFHVRIDYVIHFCLFFPWAFFLFGFKRIKWWLWLIIGVLAGICYEVIQYCLRYRSFSVKDIVADSLGLISGFLLVFIINIIIKAFRRKKVKSYN